MSTLRVGAAALLVAALGACGGEPRATPHRQSAARIEAAHVETQPALEASEAAGDDAEGHDREPAADEDAEPDFAAPMPEVACPDEVRVRLAHRSAVEPGLPAVLGHAMALRSEDGRHVRVVLADQPLERDAIGRFVAPEEGHARFELDAVRHRRGPLAPGPLGGPDSRRGALTHVRVVSAGPLLTFGHRDIGRVELTHVDAERVCGRVELDDGFGRVRGAFTAPVVGVVPR